MTNESILRIDIAPKSWYKILVVLIRQFSKAIEIGGMYETRNKMYSSRLYP